MSQDLLINAIKKNARFFLEEAGEFYPFGMCITWENEIVPVDFDSSNETKAKIFVLDELKNKIKKYIDSGVFSKSAIAFDVKIKSENNFQNSLAVLLYEAGKDEAEYHYAYVIEDGELKYL